MDSETLRQKLNEKYEERKKIREDIELLLYKEKILTDEIENGVLLLNKLEKGNK